MRGIVHPGAAGFSLPRFYPAERHRGHKKAHLSWIMAHVPDWAESFGDAFGGSGIVGWHAKTHGLQIFVNDVMAFSHLRAKVLIVNGSVRLDERDLDILDEANPAHLHIGEEWYANAMGAASASWLDNLAANLPKLENPMKQDVAAYVAISTLMARMNYSQVRFTISHRFAGKRYLDGFDWGREFRNHALNVFPLILHDNGLANEACRGDALAFVRSHRIDCLYLDPPFAGSSRYEQDLGFYDKLVLLLTERHGDIGDPFNGPVPLPPHTNFSNRSKGLMGLALLFRAAAHVPRIILSYNTTSGIHPDEIARDGERIYGKLVVREERPALLPTARADRPRKTKDVLLVFDRCPFAKAAAPAVTPACDQSHLPVTVLR